jgi:putative transcriptional regulator
MEVDLNKIKEFRTKKNLSQADIAKYIGVKQNTISQWEREERNPSILQALRLSEILDTTIESLYK